MISVIIPTYNRGTVIKSSIQSVLNQTYKNIEVIIVDDCSEDNTQKIVEDLAVSDSRIRYIKLDKNLGACAARNIGIEASVGEFIAFHDSDDICYPDKLDIQIKAIQDNKADVVFCKMNNVVSGKRMGIVPETDKFNEGFLDDDEEVFGISTQTIFAKRKVFEECKFDVSFPRFQDFELMIRIKQLFSIYCVAKPLVDFCISEDSISKNSLKLYITCQLLLKKYPNFRNDYPNTSKKLAYKLLRDYVFLNKKEKKAYCGIFSLISIFDSSFKVKIKIFLARIGLLRIIYILRKKEYHL